MPNLERNPQSPDSVNANQKTFSIRTVLNIYGVFASLGLILSIITVSISLDGNLKLYFSEEHNRVEKNKEFLVFIFVQL